MSDLERYLSRVCHSISSSASLRRHLKEELREHLSEIIEALVDSGLSEEEATQKAIEEFGDVESVRDGLEAIHGRRTTALLIEKAMDWKERTMKSEWKWSFATQFFTGLTIITMLLLAGGIPVYVLPQITAVYAKFKLLVPHQLELVLDFSRWIKEWLLLLVLLVVAVWIVFEVRCKKDYKSTIRSAWMAMASLPIALVAAWISLVTVVCIAIALSYGLPAAHTEELILPAVESVAESFEEFSSAVSEEDWGAVKNSAGKLSNDSWTLNRWGSAAPILAGLDGRKNIDEIRVLLKRLADSSSEVRRIVRANNLSLSSPSYVQLCESYERLTELVEGWPSVDKPPIEPAE